MKHKLIITMAIVFMTLLVGCTKSNPNDGVQPGEQNNVVQTKLTADQTIAFSTYIASGFLSAPSQDANIQLLSSQTNVTSPAFLSTQRLSLEENKLSIEDQLSDITVYFDRLRIFMDYGIENAINTQAVDSSNEDYEVELNYTVDGEVYTIFYNENEDGELTGILLYNDIEFELTGKNEIDDDEHEIEFKTVDKQNPNNWIEIEIEIEEDEDEYSFEMKLIMEINGHFKEVKIEFSHEEDEVEIELEIIDGDSISKFEFEKEIDDDEIEYKFEYEFNNVKGEVKINVFIDENGVSVYRYKIKESGQTKDVDIYPDHDDLDDDDDDDDNDADDDNDEDNGDNNHL